MRNISLKMWPLCVWSMVIDGVAACCQSQTSSRLTLALTWLEQLLWAQTKPTASPSQLRLAEGDWLNLQTVSHQAGRRPLQRSLHARPSHGHAFCQLQDHLEAEHQSETGWIYGHPVIKNQSDSWVNWCSAFQKNLVTDITCVEAEARAGCKRCNTSNHRP